MSRPSRTRQFRLFRRLHPGPALLLLAAVGTVVVGGLSQRWGPAWYHRLIFIRPTGIVVHHSATPPVVAGRRVDADFLDEVHAAKGWGMRFGDRVYHIGYHYVILPDGTVQSGRPDWMPGAHTAGHNDYLGICLVGDFSQHHGHCAHPTTAQRQALVKLLRSLIRKYRLKSKDIYRHSDLGATRCPGAGVPWDQIISELEAGDRALEQPTD